MHFRCGCIHIKQMGDRRKRRLCNCFMTFVHPCLNVNLSSVVYVCYDLEVHIFSNICLPQISFQCLIWANFTIFAFYIKQLLYSCEFLKLTLRDDSLDTWELALMLISSFNGRIKSCGALEIVTHNGGEHDVIFLNKAWQ